MLATGCGQTSSVWTPDLLKNLAQNRQVTIFDNRGIGLSTDTRTNITILDFAESTIDFTKALQLGQPDILSWSTEGFVAMTHYPEAVNRIVLTDTTSGGQGFSSASTTLRAKLSQFTEQPVPPNIFYPDTTAGRMALCRYNSFHSGTTPLTPTKAKNKSLPSKLCVKLPQFGLHPKQQCV